VRRKSSLPSSSNSRLEVASTFLARVILFSIACGTAQKGVRYFTDTESAQDVQDQRHLGLFGEPRINAGEHHPQLVVLDGVWPKAASMVGRKVHSDSSRRLTSGAKVRAVRSRRRTSTAWFFAVVISHADGLPACRGVSTLPTPGTRLPASHLPPAPGVNSEDPSQGAIMRPDSRRNRWVNRIAGQGIAGRPLAGLRCRRRRVVSGPSSREIGFFPAGSIR